MDGVYTGVAARSEDAIAIDTDDYSSMVAARTGGQGKTAVAQILAIGLRRAGLKPTLVSVDAGEDGSMSKLAMLEPGVIDLGIAADMGDVVKRGEEAVRHWDGLASVLDRRNLVIDLGANAVGALFRWAEMADLGDAEDARPLNVVIPVTAQQNAALDAIAVLERSYAVGDALQIARRVVVFNDAHGPVDEVKGQAMDRLRAMVAERAIPTVRIEKTLLEACDKGASFQRLSEMTGEEYQKFMEFEHLITGKREIRQFKEWLERGLAQFRALGLLPPARPSAVGAK